jgi:hypothetical protein
VGLGRASHEEGAAQVNIHYRIPVGGAHSEDQVVSDDAGAVDQHCHGSKLSSSPSHGLTGGLFVCDIRTKGERTAAVLDNLLRSASTALLVQVNDTDGHPIRRESKSDGGTNAARRAGDDCNSHAETVCDREPAAWPSDRI